MGPKKAEGTTTTTTKSKSSHASYQVRIMTTSELHALVHIANRLQDMITDAIIAVNIPVP